MPRDPWGCCCVPLNLVPDPPASQSPQPHSTVTGNPEATIWAPPLTGEKGICFYDVNKITTLASLYFCSSQSFSCSELAEAPRFFKTVIFLRYKQQRKSQNRYWTEDDSHDRLAGHQGKVRVVGIKVDSPGDLTGSWEAVATKGI